MTPAPANDNRPAWFDALLAQYEPFLRKRCNVLAPASPEDAYQEAVCRALATWHRYRRDGHFPTWLNYIVRHIQFDWRLREFKYPYQPNVAQNATQDTLLLIDEAISSDETGVIKLSAVGFTHREMSKMIRRDKKAIGQMLRDAVAVAANDNEPARKAA